jgi:hypothetical protein
MAVDRARWLRRQCFCSVFWRRLAVSRGFTRLLQMHIGMVPQMETGSLPSISLAIPVPHHQRKEQRVSLMAHLLPLSVAQSIVTYMVVTTSDTKMSRVYGVP